MGCRDIVARKNIKGPKICNSLGLETYLPRASHQRFFSLPKPHDTLSTSTSPSLTLITFLISKMLAQTIFTSILAFAATMVAAVPAPEPVVADAPTPVGELLPKRTT